MLGIAILIMPTWACDSESADDDTASEIDASHPSSPTSEATSLEDAPPPTDEPQRWSHPLQAAVGITPLPIFEAKNAPDGRRYSILGGSQDLGDGVVEHSGIVTLERRATPRPGDPIVDEPPPTRRTTQTVRSKISPDLMTELQREDGAEQLEVVVLGERSEESLQWELEREIALGHATDDASYKQQRNRLVAERQSRTHARNEHLTRLIKAGGGEVLRTCVNFSCVEARVPRGTVAKLSDDARVRSIGPRAVAGAPTTATGLATRHATQVKQFIDAGFDGHGPTVATTSDNVVVAVFEPPNALGGSTTQGGFDEDHPSLRTSGGGSFRRAFTNVTDGWRWFCDGPMCAHSDTSSPAWLPAGHPTQVAGAILGDYEQDQDPTLTLEEAQSASGYAPEAVHHLVLSNNASGMIEAFDEMIGLPSAEDPPHIINNSYKYGYPEDCDGDDVLSAAANEAYRSGIAVISAANNDGGSATSCAVRAPGAAIGSFTVGAHAGASDDTPLDLRDSDIFDNGNGQESAWGGNPSEGQNRSIVSITAPGRKTGHPEPDGTTDATNASSNVAATSLATALTTGLAADVMDVHLSAGQTWIDHPGRLYSMLLLMGDRQGTSGKRTSGFDHLWGAGRLRARMVKSGGLDAPYYFWHGSTCIDHGEFYYFDLRGGNTLPSDINTIKASAFWFDKRHDTTGEVANIDMLLYSDNYSVYSSDTDPDDNKAFVYFDTPDAAFPQSPVHLRIYGRDVNGHDGGCGTDSVMVHWAMFAEDGDRESPTYNPATGEGIAPERE